MHYVFLSVKKDFDFKAGYKAFEKLEDKNTVRRTMCECNYFFRFVSELANRVGIEDLDVYKKEIGSVVFDKEQGKVLMLNDLDQYDDPKIEELIQKMLRAQYKTRYYLLPLLLRPFGEGVIHKDNVSMILTGLEILVDEYDLESDLICDLIELFTHAIEKEEEIFCCTMDTNKIASITDVALALPFIKTQIQTAGFIGGIKNLITFNPKK